MYFIFGGDVKMTVVQFGRITIQNLSFNGKTNFLLKEYQKSRPGCVMYEHAL